MIPNPFSLRIRFISPLLAKFLVIGGGFLGAWLGGSGPCYGVTLLAGLGVVDQGDDVSRPAWSLGGRTTDYFGSYHLYGRSFGKVTERQQIIAAGFNHSWFGPWPVQARTGLAILHEATKITLATGAKQEANFALGLALGVGWQQAFGPFVVAASWDSYLYPPGIAGAILLASGRKHIINLMVGIPL